MSLLERYAAADKKKHQRKRGVVRRIGSAVLDAAVALIRRFRGHGPDLPVYTPDGSDWFFVGAKSPGDSMRKGQREKFEEVVRITGKPIRRVRFKEVNA